MLRRLTATAPTWIPLPLRLALGLVFIGHGAQKLFGVWGGKGLAEYTSGSAPFDLQPAWLWLGAAAFAEFFGGLLVLLGLLTRLGAFLILPVMLVAIFGVHWGSNLVPTFFLQNRGIEYTLALFAMALALVISGGGRASIDEALMSGHRISSANRRR